MTDAAPHPLAARFAQFLAFLLEGILEGIADCGGRHLIAGPLTLRLQVRFNKMARRFAALVAHLVAFGAVAPVRAYHRKQPPPAATVPQDPPQVRPPDPNPRQNPLPKWARPAARRPAPPLSQAVRVPSRSKWLVGLSLNGAIARLQHFVYEPEVAALLAASPRLVALLRPLCRMLAVEFPHGILPPRPPRAPRPRRRRWHPPRRGDLHFLLRMGKPLPEA